MYSQNDEEQVIVNYFQRRQGTGRFLDVGAYDGKTFSNTLRLAELCWTGVMVEPNPDILDALALNMDGFDVEVIRVAITEIAGVAPHVNFFACNDAVATCDAAHAAKWRPAGVAFREVDVPALTWEQLFDAVDDDFDFLDLDVEGRNVALFDALPLERLECLQLMCIEYDGEPLRIAARAKAYGFNEIHRTGENIILAR